MIMDVSLLPERLSVFGGEFSTVTIGDFTTVIHSRWRIDRGITEKAVDTGGKTAKPFRVELIFASEMV
ncbi:hypothetical protein [Novibacillus thermophilus]|uniref:hypothetical protein n=1 Tax=Novibacillus thermophilus TaxID=1471761 RepID=UPI0014761A57|nr:hypothetical protein [Novibacillus thermophilus]